MTKTSLAAAAVSLLGLMGARAHADDAILHRLRTITTVASTVPANGDVNPYGVALVRNTMGRLHAGHILVSNFNNSKNLQGTGTTIVDVAPNGSVSLFARIDATKLPGRCPGGVGLTTALVALKAGWVIVGSLPTTDGTAATARAGCLIVLNDMGVPVETFSGGPINGPWDMTADDRVSEASLFFTNVLNGTVAANGRVVNKGNVVRLDLAIDGPNPPSASAMTVIAGGFPERTDPAALVIGPTGLGLGVTPSCSPLSGAACSRSDAGGHRVLYVADTLSNRIGVVSRPLGRSHSAGVGTTLSIGGSLNGPLGLAVAGNGHILTVNSGNGLIVETSQTGEQLARKFLDETGSPPGAGALFGVLARDDTRIFFVDDASNTLRLLN